MEFESPDVEREFPGLYASESAKRSNESDFSDESHERISKKDLLIGKRKDKKDKKDRGYATLEGESSPEEESEVKSPSKVKKSKPFKFPSKKEKREKSRDKDNKDKESDKDKKKEDKDKEKKKESKIKLKSKDKKDKKHSEEVIEITEDLPIFGVPLSVAVERSKCHDGVDIPLIIRNCIDHVQETGLMAENVYKVSGIKSRVQQVRKMYNSHEPVYLADFDLPVATSLLKQFLRELPEPVLTTELVGRFEEAGAMKEVSARGARLRELVDLLPSCNRVLLGWLIKHFDALAAHEKYNKMNAQTISVTISPLLQISQRLLTALLCHVTELYPHLELVKYVPPLSSTSPVLPDTTEGLALELFKQESLLSQIHREMNQGLIGKDREEQLWGVQRIITQLKRKLRALERSSGQRSLDDTDSSLRLEETSFQKKSNSDVAAGDCSSKPTVVEEERNLEVPSVSKEPSCSGGSRKGSGELSPWIPMEETAGGSGGRRETLEDVAAFTPPSHSPREETPSPSPLVRSVMTAESLEVQDINREATEKAEKKQRALLETEELVAEIARLKLAMEEERNTLEKIKGKIHALGGMPYTWSSLSDSSDDDVIPPSTLEQNGLWKRKVELKEESKRLQAKKRGLIESISNESDACVDLRVQIKLLQMGKSC